MSDYDDDDYPDPFVSDETGAPIINKGYNHNGDEDEEKPNRFQVLEAEEDDIDPVANRECEDQEEDIDLDFSRLEQDNNLRAIKLGSVKMATDTCLHKYAIDRLQGAQNNTILWPPKMLSIFQYFYKGKPDKKEPYKRTNLLTERNFAMLELLLNVPIQLRIVYVPSVGQKPPVVLDLNDTNKEGYCTAFDHNFSSFVEAKELLHDLIQEGIIQPHEVRKFRTSPY